MRLPVPTTIITGGLGVGKTTFISQLLQLQRDSGSSAERWAVVINEFGALGLDSALLQPAPGPSHAPTVIVRELPGGCMCCTVAGLLPVALAQLLRQAKPDRLLIEPSGLGHPAGLIQALQSGPLAPSIALKAVVCLVDIAAAAAGDMLTWSQPQLEQIDVADVLVGGKADLAESAQAAAFLDWAAKQWPPKQQVYSSTQELLQASAAVLDLPRAPVHASLTSLAPQRRGRGGAEQALQPVAPAPPDPHRPARYDNAASSEHRTVGWLFHPSDVFDRVGLKSWVAFNWVRDLHVAQPTAPPELTPTAYIKDSRMEVILEAAANGSSQPTLLGVNDATVAMQTLTDLLGGCPVGGPLGDMGFTQTVAGSTSSLFVKGLAKGTNERQLHAIFSAFGGVADVQVARHRSGRSAGFAVVSFVRQEDAQRALLCMDNAVLANRRLSVRWYTPELQQSSVTGGGLTVAQALAAMLAPQPDQAAAGMTDGLSAQLLLHQLSVLSNASSASPSHHAAPALAAATAAAGAQQHPMAGAMGPGLAGWSNSMPQVMDINVAAGLFAPNDSRAAATQRRLSPDGSDLAAFMLGRAAFPDGNGQPGMGAGASIHAIEALRRCASSCERVLPSLPPPSMYQSEDGGCLMLGGTSMRHTGAPRNDTATQLTGIKSETGSDHDTGSSSSLQLPNTLDIDSLLLDERPAGATQVQQPASSTVASTDPVGGPPKSRSNPTMRPSSGIGMPQQVPASARHPRHSLSSLSQAHLAVAAGAGSPQPPPVNRAHDLSSALSLSSLGLDTSRGMGGGAANSMAGTAQLPEDMLLHHLSVPTAGASGAGAAGPQGPRNRAHMEAAIRQAQQADQMIAQLSMMRSQALLAYHTAAVMTQHQQGQPMSPHGGLLPVPSVFAQQAEAHAGRGAHLPRMAASASQLMFGKAQDTAQPLEAMLAAHGATAMDIGNLAGLMAQHQHQHQHQHQSQQQQQQQHAPF